MKCRNLYPNKYPQILRTLVDYRGLDWIIVSV
jgi:hypothetical protein